MSEANLWQRIRKAYPRAREVDPRLALAHLDRVENGVGAGAPDFDCCINGVDSRVELKYRGDAPKRDETAVFTTKGLRDSQIIWHYHRCKAGGRIFICSQVDDIVFMHRSSGELVQKYNMLSLNELLRTAVWTDTDGWPNFFRILAGLACK